MTNEELVRRAQAGHVPSREALARRWLGRVYGAALASTGRPADADDLAQETMLRAFRALPTLRDPARFGPWVLRILRNVARDGFRRPARPASLGARDAEVSGASREGPRAAPGPDGEAISAWRSLPGRQRLVTWLKIMDGLRFEDIAALTGTSKSAAHRTFRKGLARLRRELSRC